MMVPHTQILYTLTTFPSAVCYKYFFFPLAPPPNGNVCSTTSKWSTVVPFLPFLPFLAADINIIHLKPQLKCLAFVYHVNKYIYTYNINIIAGRTAAPAILI